MIIGASKRILITFNTAIIADLNNVIILQATLFVGRRKLLSFKLFDATGYDGLISIHPTNTNVGVIMLDNALSKKLIAGQLKMEVWMEKLNAQSEVETYPFTVDVDTVVEPVDGI